MPYSMVHLLLLHDRAGTLASNRNIIQNEELKVHWQMAEYCSKSLAIYKVSGQYVKLFTSSIVKKG